MSLPGAILSSPRIRALDENGDVVPGAKLLSYEAGTSTPLATYSDSDLDIANVNTNPVVADAGGLFGPIFLLPQGYKFVLTDADDVTIWTQDEVEDIGQAFLANLGDELAIGGKDVTSGYTVLATDNFVTVSNADGDDPATVTLQASADRGMPITIKNKTAVELAIDPSGAETIDGVSGAYTLPASASPNFPTVTLVPIASGYLILSSHGL